ncbi:hypothetical protein RJ55_10036 [Drechmeria coniospora]|nr:hypothetical protein RJ55_10036 [Drechmeria coniospora]
MKFTNALLFTTLASADAIHRRHEEASGSNKMLEVDESGTRLPLHKAGSEISVKAAPQPEMVVDESGTLLPPDEPGREIFVEPASQREIATVDESGTLLPPDAPSIRSRITAIRIEIQRFNSTIMSPSLRFHLIITTTGQFESRLETRANALLKTVAGEIIAGEPKEIIAGEPKEIIKLYRAFASDCLMLESSIRDYVVPWRPTVEQYGRCLQMETTIQSIQARLLRVSK